MARNAVNETEWEARGALHRVASRRKLRGRERCIKHYYRKRDKWRIYKRRFNASTFAKRARWPLITQYNARVDGSRNFTRDSVFCSWKRFSWWSPRRNYLPPSPSRFGFTNRIFKLSNLNEIACVSFYFYPIFISERNRKTLGKKCYHTIELTFEVLR